MGSKATSSTSTTNTTEQKDMKVAGGDESINIGAGASLSIIDELDEETVEVFKNLINFSQSSVDHLATNQKDSLEVIKDRLENQESALNQMADFMEPIIWTLGSLGALYIWKKGR